MTVKDSERSVAPRWVKVSVIIALIVVVVVVVMLIVGRGGHGPGRHTVAGDGSGRQTGPPAAVTHEQP